MKNPWKVTLACGCEVMAEREVADAWLHKEPYDDVVCETHGPQRLVGCEADVPELKAMLSW